MKKKLLLLSDDIRLHSGVGTMSRKIVEGTVASFDWVQFAAAVKHPEEGQRKDISKEVQEQTGVEDASVILIPTSGYGNQELLRKALKEEKPDAILHFTDPRFWGWLYDMEHEIRQDIPILYYNIWDDLPFPHWNEPFYDCCDLLMAISKQTYNINRHVCTTYPRTEGVDLTYVPHGIDPDEFRPVNLEEDGGDQLQELKKQMFHGREDAEFIAFFNSRNIRRKGTADLIQAFNDFAEQSNLNEKAYLVLHTDPVDDNGTDLQAVSEALCPSGTVVFSPGKVDSKILNYMYNLADVVCCPSSAEGFGLSHAEALMSGTPTIATVIGGLQDQMGFKKDGRYLTVDDFTADKPTNSTGLISKEHGDWVYPLWPNPSLQGSPATPYIYDSRPKTSDITKGLLYWWKKTKTEREAAGLKGRVYMASEGFTSANMCEQMTKSINTALDAFKPRARFTLRNCSQINKKETGALA